jgi:quercetin dioxygenase-like cupin family protein
MQTTEIEKLKVHNLSEIIEYVANSVESKTILRKTTGSIKVIAFDTGEALSEAISPFDTFIEVIEGIAEFKIDGRINNLQKGQGIIVPAHSAVVVKALRKFKMITTVIKSGYEGAIL